MAESAHVTRVDQRDARGAKYVGCCEYQWCCSCGQKGPWLLSRTAARNGGDVHRANAKVQGL